MKSLNIKLLLVFIFSASIFSLSAQETMQSTMQRANEAYQKQKYNEAVSLYMEVVNAGNEGSVLFYNLGNAYYKSNHNAEALLWYERALRLDPRNEDIKHNIAFVNRQLVDRIEVLPELFITRWWNAISMSHTANTWAILSIVFCCIMLVFLALMFVSKVQWLRSLGLPMAIVGLVLMIFSIIFAHTENTRYEKNPQAIVMQPVVNAKSTPNANEKDLFVIHEGLKVGVTDKLNDWVEIKLPNGEKGWVLAKGVEII